MTDFRALCAELVETWDATADFDFNDFGNASADIVTRARAALVEPVGEAPTDQELDRLLYYEFTTSTGHGERQDAMGFARAVLARWGRPAIEPAPVVAPAEGLVERVAALSPAAQAARDHFLANVPISLGHGLAAALRAAADQVVPEQKPWHRTGLPGSTKHDVRAELLALAAELERADG